MSKGEYNNKQEDNYSIAWKRHDEFFRSLNVKLDEISYIGELCYQDKMRTYDYFAKLKNLFNKHYVYFRDKQNLKRRFNSIENALYNSTFKADLNARKASANEHLHILFMKLQDLLSEMIEDFAAPELIPKAVKHEVDPWAEEKDTKKRMMYQTVTKLFENV